MDPPSSIDLLSPASTPIREFEVVYNSQLSALFQAGSLRIGRAVRTLGFVELGLRIDLLRVGLRDVQIPDADHLREGARDRPRIAVLVRK